MDSGLNFDYFLDRIIVSRFIHDRDAWMGENGNIGKNIDD
jgi:hypothetical protein